METTRLCVSAILRRWNSKSSRGDSRHDCSSTRPFITYDSKCCFNRFCTGDTPGIDSEGEFDSGEFIRTQAQLSNPNSQQASDLFGNFANDLMTNPLFSAAPAGVQYLSKGRQRDYGNAIYNVASKLQNYAGARRRGFGNRLTGIVI